MVGGPVQTIKSARRVLQILEYFDSDRRYATVMDMSRTLNYPQSSTSELLRCLARLGYLDYNRTLRTYCPTARVAVLGAWAKPSLFRGGPILSAIDEVARLVDETVALSASANYVLQHLQVIRGKGDDAIKVYGGDELPILHSPQGRLLLSSRLNEDIKSVVHRLNAEEPDLARHVRLTDLLSECVPLRERGWIIEHDRDGVGCVAVLLSCDRNMERLALSVLAKPSVIEWRGQQILELLMSRRDALARLNADECGGKPDLSAAVPLSPPTKVANYRRHFA